MSLLEVLIALAILAVALLGLSAGLVVASTASSARRAVTVAVSLIEPASVITSTGPAITSTPAEACI